MFYILVFLLSALSASLTCAAIYILWLRGVLRRLREVQTLLKNLSSGIESIEKLESSSAEVPKVQMSVEGKKLAIIEINGRRVIRFQDELSEVERNRIVRYLKTEGFISS